MPTAKKILPAEVRRMLSARQATAVDVREAYEYAAGHIPNAVLLPLGSIESSAEAVLPSKQEAYIVYCRSGRRSALAVKKLGAMGYQKLYDLGGILDWPYETER